MYNQLSLDEKHLLIESLHSMRILLKKTAIKVRAKKTSKKKKKDPLAYLTAEQRTMFENLHK